MLNPARFFICLCLSQIITFKYLKVKKTLIKCSTVNFLCMVCSYSDVFMHTDNYFDDDTDKHFRSFMINITFHRKISARLVIQQYISRELTSKECNYPSYFRFHFLKIKIFSITYSSILFPIISAFQSIYFFTICSPFSTCQFGKIKTDTFTLPSQPQLQTSTWQVRSTPIVTRSINFHVKCQWFSPDTSAVSTNKD